MAKESSCVTTMSPRAYLVTILLPCASAAGAANCTPYLAVRPALRVVLPPKTQSDPSILNVLNEVHGMGRP
ncbi:MAG: hypothetical protein BWY85_01069 [Firmicutes bacterium ADurb.Bin506]|nr:MAG: hypothetical protein BWY85_01069 [Firmicutes bacterium ADurb.Bin506]